MRLFLFGILFGAIGGLLSAPGTGRSTRAQLRDKAIRYSHEGREFLERKSRHLNNVMQGYRARAKALAEQAREQAREVSERARERMSA